MTDSPRQNPPTEDFGDWYTVNETHTYSIYATSIDDAFDRFREDGTKENVIELRGELV